MERIARAALVCVIILLSSSHGIAVHHEVSNIRKAPRVTSTSVNPQPGSGWQQVNLFIDFSDYAEGSVEEWLQAKGFRFEKGAQDRDLLALSANDGSLVLEAKGHVRGFLVNQEVTLEKFSSIRITWGIIKYPQNASYERQVNNEALMLYIFFGQDKLPSGHVGVPDLPYFIGLFLCEKDKINTPYVGKYFHEGGRFVCLGNPPPHETMISEFNLLTAFQTYFEKDKVPRISGISLGVDTSSSGNGGKGAAYIRKIEFLR
jgi:hypothetical protein